MDQSSTHELISGVDFAGVPVRDLETAAEFYGQTLGLRQSAYMPERSYAEFETGNLTLSVFNAESSDSSITPIATRSRCMSTTWSRRAEYSSSAG
jgi:catechol 2,3-dioxygenase-like lactoylglutathione lyase family enzyme